MPLGSLVPINDETAFPGATGQELTSGLVHVRPVGSRYRRVNERAGFEPWPERKCAGCAIATRGIANDDGKGECCFHGIGQASFKCKGSRRVCVCTVCTLWGKRF